MENFVKLSYENVNGNTVINGKLMERSLVLFNDKGVVYNIAAKVRNGDKYSMVRALAKAVLASMREANQLNATEAAQESKKRVVNKITPALSCYAIMLTDKNRNIVKDVVLSVRDRKSDSGKLRDVIRFTKSMPIYELVVERGLDWADERVKKALNAWTTATIEQLDYVKNLDIALGRAADSTEAEEDKAEAEKAKAEAEAEAKKAA